MGIVRNPANTMRRGRVGETTYYISGGQQIARQALNGSNFGESARRSTAQQRRRVMWANLVNFYKASRTWMPKAFETKKRNQSDYNKFMQLNINSNKVALAKAEAEAGACVAADYLISQGSLPSIAINRESGKWVTNIAAGSLVISSSTTVGEFSIALVGANANIRTGMQLSFVSYQQSIDSMGTPRVICRCYEVTIDTENSTPLYASFPEFCSVVTNGFLGTGVDISIGGFAYILSEQTSTGLTVSTQQLIVNNSDLISKYTSTIQRNLAVISYGVDQEVILSPADTIQQSPEAQPLYISYIVVNNKRYDAGDYVGSGTSLSGKPLQINFNRTLDSPTSRGELTFANLDMADFSSSSSSSQTILFTIEDQITESAPLSELKVICDNGTEISIRFSTSATDSDL